MAAGRKNTLLMGVGYEMWLNKFGNHATAAGVTKPGINTYAPTLQVEWHFGSERRVRRAWRGRGSSGLSRRCRFGGRFS